VTEVEAAVVGGRADAAVHSAKDMTSAMTDRLVLAAVPRRADPRDGLVGCTLADLPPGGLIATGSARRRAQLAYARPDLSFIEVRGNMERRVSRGEDGSVSAVVVAVAAMERLGWMHRLTDILDPVDVLPQAGQGAIAVQCRRDDEATRALLATIDDGPSHRALRAERAVLAGLGGSCTVPVGAWAVPVSASSPASSASPPSSALVVHGLVASGDGRVVIRMSRRGDDPELVGAEVAEALLVEGGGSGIEGFDGAALSGRRAGAA
jgi:hydroxymethylbilane synthase